MNTPRCVLCGSENIVMNDTELFVCCNCGARFTIEAMRNLMANNEERNDGGNFNNNPEPQFRYGNAISDALVDQFEKGLYDLAAASWNQLKDKQSDLNPWVILLGDLAEELNKGIDETMYLSPSYAAFKHACDSQPYNPMVECPLYIKALSICTAVPISFIGRQQASAKAAIATRDYIKAIEYNVSINQELTGLDKIRINALMDIASCVSAGYAVTSEEWMIVKQQVEAIDLTRKIPLVDRIYERLKTIIAARFVAPEYALPPDDATEDQLIERARTWWSANDYDLAANTYARLVKSNDTAVSIEANTAIRFLSEIVEDIACTIDIHTSFMEKKYREACNDAAVIGGAKGSDLLDQLIRIAGVLTGIGTFYLNIAQAYIKIEDKDNADKFLTISTRYLSVTKRSFTLAVQSLMTILDEKPADIDSKHVAEWKLRLNTLGDVFEDKGLRLECLHKLKDYYIRLLNNDSSFQEQLAAATAEIDDEHARVDAEISEIEQQITELLIEIAELEVRVVTPEIAELESRVEQFQSDISRQESRINEMKEDAARLESDVKDKQTIFNSLGLFARKKKAEIKTEIDSLEAQANDLRSMIDTAIDEMNGRIYEMNTASDRIAVLKGKRAEAEATIEEPILRIDRTADAINDQAGRLVELRDRLSGLVKKLEMCKEEKSRVKEPTNLEQELAEQKWQALE